MRSFSLFIFRTMHVVHSSLAMSIATPIQLIEIARTRLLLEDPSMVKGIWAQSILAAVDPVPQGVLLPSFCGMCN